MVDLKLVTACVEEMRKQARAFSPAHIRYSCPCCSFDSESNNPNVAIAHVQQCRALREDTESTFLTKKEKA